MKRYLRIGPCGEKGKERASLFLKRSPRPNWSKLVMQACLVAGLASVTGVADAEDDAVQRGRRLYTLCSVCHGPDGLGEQRFQAPSLAGLPEWYLLDQINKFRDGRRGAHHLDTAGLLMRPMAKTLRTADEVAAVAAYLATLSPKVPEPTLKEGDATKGQAQYALCAACHGAQLEGNETLKSPSLRYLPDWYQLAQLKKYKAGIRGGADPSDTQSIQMQAITSTLPDEQAMLDIMAYVNELAKKPFTAVASPSPADPSAEGDADALLLEDADAEEVDPDALLLEEAESESSQPEPDAAAEDATQPSTAPEN